MKINQTLRSPNYDRRIINIEFLVLHYTAGNLKRTIELFMDPTSKVSAHLVISQVGEVYELVKCWQGKAYRAHHAGKSVWDDGDKSWRDFNDFSIGIELVNLNGNIFPYTDAQYHALQQVITHFISLYPTLTDPQRVVGHEQVASFHGKADPGLMFDWLRFFKLCYPRKPAPPRIPACPQEFKTTLEKLATFVPKGEGRSNHFWHVVSEISETSVRLLS